MLLRPRLAAAVCSALLTLVLAAPAFAQFEGVDEGQNLRNAQMVKKLLAGRANRLSASAGPDPDTVFVGKSATNHISSDNYWNIHTGTYRPGTNVANNALWDWDNSVGIQAVDSLHGWWPVHTQYFATGGLTLPDHERPWWALDHGNIGNYVLSQNASAKRTFGVVGMWHADPGNPAHLTNKGLQWSPLGGTQSAWCGLRQHADVTVSDAVTGNPFNQDVVQFLHDASGNGSNNGFPGYPDQIDQLLYRDIAMTPSQSLIVTFNYRTRMSTSIGMAAATRTGWFHGDPLAVTAGNFISSSAAGASAPQDSFMVYVGAPVNDAACVYSDGVTRPVYDKQRRWFSEVIKVFGAGNNYFEIFQRAGNNPADTLDATPSSGAILVPAAQISTVLGGANGNVRLVFRCKTNRGFADSDTRASGYSSAGRGAVLVDDVTISIGGGGPVVFGDFELAEQGGVGAIDNRFPGVAGQPDPPAGVNSENNWRSTGKPPGEYMHIEALSNLAYNDLCGPPDSPARICNMSGLVVTVGHHDQSERSADPRFMAFREIRQVIVSPTISLMPGPGGAANSQGISATIKQASDDYILWYDVYTGMFDWFFTGNLWNFGSQCYPAQQPNGAECWGQTNGNGLTVFDPEPQCFTDLEGFRDNGTPFRTSRAGGIPDSLRLYLYHAQQCFRFGVTLGCNSAEGGYFDNVSLAFVDLPGVPGQASASSTVSLGAVSSDIWHFVNDTFPANETASLPGTSLFDTTAALVRTGVNLAPNTFASVLRFDLPGDSSVVFAANAQVTAPEDPALAQVRLDLVFRILPGPGNYQIAAGRNMAPGGVPSGVLLQLPMNQATIVAPGDGSFWGQYMADPGLVSAGTHGGPGGWSPLVWNSCRMDTTQLNIFPVGGAVPTFTGLTTGSYMTMIHEADPKFASLGVDKFWCFVLDTTKAATSSPTVNNVTCNGTVPAWLTTVPSSRTGWNGSATTKEFTKIIPDGLLTPGSHVQYFYRKSHAIDPLLNYSTTPDTNLITPQSREGSTDMHRWQQFSVLPDRWKASAFGGAGAACMLYVDLNDRRGNEGLFVSVMDSIGGTAAAKWGAHNGWHAPGSVNVNGLDVRTNMSVAVSDRNSQPGTTWDMYGVKGVETSYNAGALGSRLANRTAMGFAAGRESRQGPTPEMLRAYYRVLALLSGDLVSGLLGPLANRSQDDIALLDDFLMAAGGTAQPRGIFAQGDGFAESEMRSSGIVASHLTFLNERLGVRLRNLSYRAVSGNLDPCVDLVTTAMLAPAGDIYGVMDACSWSNDVLEPYPAVAEAAAAAYYQDVGSNGPYASDVVKPATALRNWVALTSGYDIEHLYSRYCDTSTGRLAYYWNALNNIFGSICQLAGSPAITLDTPQSGRGGPYVNFMKLGDALMRHGESTVHLGIAQTGRVQVNVYDVAGRKVRLLADRVFPAGEQRLVWDGTDDGGRKVARGVYFVRSSTQKEAGRIVVLNH